jgi:2-amino-4-hydroxy-6-hydroxymethyldihydropteridine diphosphokinase
MIVQRRVLIGLGSNIGDSATMVQRAMLELERSFLHRPQRSRLWQTEPVGFRDQPAFVNAAIIGTTGLTARAIHDHCKAIELQLGRTQRERWREREIDIDVIIIEDEVFDDDGIHIPHERMAERRFVLVPSYEIASTLVCPRSGMTIEQLLAACPDTSTVDVVG